MGTSPDIERLLGDFAGYTVEVTANEAILLDWVLTAHSWDNDLIALLMHKHRALREQVGMILAGHTAQLVLNDDDLDLLLAIVPIIFGVGTQEVGASLKTKLWEAAVGKPEAKSTAPPGGEQASGCG